MDAANTPRTEGGRARTWVQFGGRFGTTMRVPARYRLPAPQPVASGGGVKMSEGRNKLGSFEVF